MLEEKQITIDSLTKLSELPRHEIEQIAKQVYKKYRQQSACKTGKEGGKKPQLEHNEVVQRPVLHRSVQLFPP